MFKKRFKIIIILGIIFFGLFSYFITEINKTNPKEVITETFVIKSGETVEQISNNLYNSNLIHNKAVFKLYAKYYGEEKFIAGEHLVLSSFSIKEIVKELSTQKKIRQEKTITIIEGWDLLNISEYLEKQGLCTKEAFLEYTNDIKNLTIKLPFNVGNVSMEGFLFPDTYRIYEDSSIPEIVDKMVNNFVNKINSLEGIKLEGDDAYEKLIMASLLEKEVRGAKGQKMVADIFNKRLDTGMKLQADSTVNYITRKGTDRSSYKDIEIDNPYNTYKYKGLPPTPICNPSFNAIKASLNPIKNNYYFFLTSPDGTIYYGRNFEEHIKNRKYL